MGHLHYQGLRFISRRRVLFLMSWFCIDSFCFHIFVTEGECISIANCGLELWLIVLDGLDHNQIQNHWEVCVCVWGGGGGGGGGGDEIIGLL